jgi:hypothetical protein
MIAVANIRTHGRPRSPWEVYIGRRNVSYGVDESPLANPFDERKYGREDCIARFTTWFEQAMLWRPAQGEVTVWDQRRDIQREVERLTNLYLEHQELTLVCWCAPLACHGHVLQAWIEANA